APALLGAECRSRLAGMGIRVPAEHRVQEVRLVEVISRGGAVATLPVSPSGLWVLDAWQTGEPGQQFLGSLIASAAELAGVELSPRRPDAVERHPPDRFYAAPGELVVRASGRAERFHAVALATGASERWGDRFFHGFQGAPHLPAAEARLRFRALMPLRSRAIRLILSPVDGVDGLYLVPAGSTVYALAYGPGAGVGELCQALMAAARDGHLGEGFEIADVSPTSLPCGAGRRLIAPGQLAVGPAAFGHPLQLGLSDTLAGCTRAAIAMAEGAPSDAGALERRYVRDGLQDLLQDARDGAAAALWLSRARERGARALTRALHRRAPANPFTSGVLGVSEPSARAVRAAARWEGLKALAASAFRSVVEPVPLARLTPQPDLYYVVDDDDEAREALQQLLEAHGAEVVSFSSELALYSAVARRPPTAVMLDVVLRWVDGLQLCQGLKQHPLTRATRVLVMSGLDLPHVRTRALEAGAEAFLPKPLDPQLVLQRLADDRAPWLGRDKGLSPEGGSARGEVG
ncbi:MAG TPA: response regulator, partial [Myxococcaceae bacterium]